LFRDLTARLHDVAHFDYLNLVLYDPERQIMLEKPGPPAMDPATADEVRSLLTKGRTGGHLFFTTLDARKTYDELKAKGGVEFTQEPTEQPYGIDFGLRDPFGNHIRVAQMAQAPTSAG